MPVFSADYLRQVGRDIFVGCGAPPEEAAMVADALVESSLMGLDSHGVVRYVEYVARVLEGKTKPGAPVRVVKETANTAVVDCGFNFGAVGGMRMVEIACEKAQQADIAWVVSRNCIHVGRLGCYVERVAEQGMFGLATCNSSKHGHWVVPWGGREGRLATNPLAYAAPTGGRPIVLDMSTSMISEGKVRVLMHQGERVPPGCIQDAAGNPTTDPNAFYGPPRGTILPFGSELGYKGFGLALLVEIMSGIAAGEASSADHPYVNGLTLIAVNMASLCGTDEFRHLLDDLCAYVTSAAPAPGHTEVMMPGTREFRTREKRLVEGIPVDDHTWGLIVQSARGVGVAIREANSSG